MHRIFRKFIALPFICCLLAGGIGVACAADAEPAHATPDQAVALVKQVVESLKKDGKDKVFAEVDDHHGPFVKGELYVFIYDLNGTCLAHGANDKLIGKNLIGMKDADGKPLIKETADLAKTKGSGWIEYKWWNPVTKSIQVKQSYIERAGDILVGVGIYKN